jgi:hypothetical protein
MRLAATPAAFSFVEHTHFLIGRAGTGSLRKRFPAANCSGRVSMIRTKMLLLLLPLALSGCLSFSSSEPPKTTTVVVPAQPATAPATIVCQTGSPPPC